MLRILALVAVLLIALLGYKLGMDGGMITLLIVVLGAASFGLHFLLKKHGAKNMLGGMANGIMSFYDPTLPPPMPSEPAPYAAGYSSPSQGYYESGNTGTYPSYNEPTTRPPSASPEERFRTTIQQVAGPDIAGSLTAGVPGSRAPSSVPEPAQPSYTPLTPVNPYEMHLGPNAYIDVQQAFINSLLLDPLGNLTRVLAEELAGKGIPLLFVDVAGNFSSLLAEFPLGWRVCSQESLQEGQVDPRAIPLNEQSKEDAQNVGHAILQEGWQVLFQFKSYHSPIDAIVTLWDIVNGMTAWERTQQRRSGRTLPSVIVITEAYRFCPDMNKHSLFKENPNVAQAVREQVVMALKTQGRDGISWYLATRKVAGMEPQAIQQCPLWMMQQPSVPEVQSGWITRYTGIEPQELQRVPPTHALIMDIATRNPQMIAFRESRSTGSDQGSVTYTLPTLPALQSLQEQTPPFPNR
jgi:hypothetical protein